MINLDEWYLDNLDESRLWLLLKVAQFMRANRMTAWPSLETLSRVCGWSEDTVRKHRKRLVLDGLLSIQYRTGKSPIYTFNRGGIGLYFGMDSTPVLEEEKDAAPPLKNTPPKFSPPLNFTPPDPPENFPPEDITYSIEDINKSIAATGAAAPKRGDVNGVAKAAKTPAKSSGKTVKITPGRAAEIFDKILGENGADPYNWNANNAKLFGELKRLLGMVQDAVEKKTPGAGAGEIEMAVEFIFRYGYDYLKSVAEKKGGPVQFKPSAIINNFNEVLSYAKSKHKRGTTDYANKWDSADL